MIFDDFDDGDGFAGVTVLFTAWWSWHKTFARRSRRIPKARRPSL
jgi:hypothetical protein